MGGIYALFSLGLSLIYGVMRVINLAHGEFMMLSAFLAFTLFESYSVDPLICLLIIGPLFFLLGIGVQKILISPITEASTLHTLLVTMGFAVILESFALITWGPDYKMISVPYLRTHVILGSIYLSFSRIISFTLAISVALVTYLFLKKTDLGKAIRACSQDREAALTMGINYNRIAMITFGIGVATAGLAGPLLASMFAIFPAVGGLFTLKAFAIIVLGGLGNSLGAIVGGLLFGIAESVETILLPAGFKEAIAFGVLVMVLLLKPSGLFGVEESE